MVFGFVWSTASVITNLLLVFVLRQLYEIENVSISRILTG